jgi:hypothetical protein
LKYKPPLKGEAGVEKAVDELSTETQKSKSELREDCTKAKAKEAMKVTVWYQISLLGLLPDYIYTISAKGNKIRLYNKTFAIFKFIQ